MRPTFLILTALMATAATAEELRQDTTGLYPMWESTGYVENAGDVRLGTNGAQVGIGGAVQVGTQPINLVERVPNAYFKVALGSTERWHIAAQAGGYQLLPGASRDLFSPMYSSRLDNPDFSVTVVPISMAASVEVARWLSFHNTVTALGVLSSARLKTSVTPGASVVAELNPHGRHGLTLNLAEVGFWAHDMSIAGASYRYRCTWLEMRVGYFYRFTKSGAQASPIASLAVLL